MMGMEGRERRGEDDDGSDEHYWQRLGEKLLVTPGVDGGAPAVRGRAAGRGGECYQSVRFFFKCSISFSMVQLYMI